MDLKPAFLTKLDSNGKLPDYVYLSLGGVVFKIGALDISKISEPKEYKIERIETASGKFKRQKVGHQPTILEINGAVHTRFANKESIEKLEKAYSDAEPLSLVDADGINLGEYIITNYNREISDFKILKSKNKTAMRPTKMSYSLKLEKIEE